MWENCLVIQSADSGRQKVLLELGFYFVAQKYLFAMTCSLKFKKTFLYAPTKSKKIVEVHIIPYPNFQFLTMINCNFTYKSSVKFLKPSHTTVPLSAC
jgi:hypothetical protein